MKKLSKVKLDKILHLTRELSKCKVSEIEDIAQKRINASKECLGDSWLALHDVVTGCTWMKDDCTNEDIYRVLEVLGWKAE